MNKIPNRQAICEVLMDKAKDDKDIMVLCSDSRGSASMTPFADNFPDQFIETGIAEQNLVSISAGLAKCGKKPFACSPACFLSNSSYEEAKGDGAYSNTNVTLIGISGKLSMPVDGVYPAMFGSWIDKFGNQGFTYIFLFLIGDSIFGILIALWAKRLDKQCKNGRTLDLSRLGAK